MSGGSFCLATLQGFLSLRDELQRKGEEIGERTAKTCEFRHQYISRANGRQYRPCNEVILETRQPDVTKEVGRILRNLYKNAPVRQALEKSSKCPLVSDSGHLYGSQQFEGEIGSSSGGDVFSATQKGTKPSHRIKTTAMENNTLRTSRRTARVHPTDTAKGPTRRGACCRGSPGEKPHKGPRNKYQVIRFLG